MNSNSTQAERKIITVKEEVKPLSRNAISKVYFINNRVEVISLDKRPGRIGNFKKLNSSMSINTITGEIIRADKKLKRADNLGSLKRSLKTLERIIDNNFTGKKSELHIVLTYSTPMYDVRKMSHDFKIFWQRFKYKYPPCKYIVIAEPHKNGGWHYHLLLKHLHGTELFIEKHSLEDTWGHGGVYIKHVSNSNNFGGYFNSKKKKSDDKLHYYPLGMRIYRCSKDIIKPQPHSMSRMELDQLLIKGNYILTSSYRISIKEKEAIGKERELNNITYEYYYKKYK